MGRIRVKDTMAAFAEVLATVDGIDKAWGYPKWGAGVGEAVVGYPESIEYDATMGDGSDRADFVIWTLVGLANEEETVALLDALVVDVKETLEADALDVLSEVLSSLRVTDAEVEVLLFDGGLRYAVLTHRIEVYS